MHVVTLLKASTASRLRSQALPDCNPHDCVLAGIGLGVFPGYSVSDYIAEGRLVPVFADWSLPTGGIHAVFPQARFRPAKVRAFVDLLASAEKKRSRGVAVA
ncbi:LysR substrate binding domain-containing protein [Mesorhizobium qingshengii]|uniref:LysR substrate binding domain-containing protein n=1 Tax=Mesorhizobium qingshengii TaxID=1165689 RepID=A0A1G5ZF19_9HYPH|nr:LysR substrate binding domain-containing protein [Mesorhizobium qingshengii]